MSASTPPPRHVAVVGGGISGLAAAHALRRRGGDHLRLTVLEGSSRIGGKLRTSEVAGVPVDEGADSILTRRPEGTGLVSDVGLAGELVSPGTTRAAVWSRGALRRIPSGQVMGVPGDLAALARAQVLSTRGLARVPLDLALPRTPIGDDVAVGAYVASRVGVEVVDRLVDPLLGAVYAGHAGLLSMEATLPQLAGPARARRSLLEGVRAAVADTPAGPPASGPVFATPRGGLGTLPPAVAAASGAHVRTDSAVRELRRTPGGWRLTVGSTRDPESVEADAVVLAVPAGPASRLLVREVPAAASQLEAIDYASVALVTLAYRPSAFPAPPGRSGYLVPAVEARPVKAVTFSTVKWPHLADLAGSESGTVIVRCSIGRYGEEHALQRPDDELVDLATAELAETTGVAERPVDTRVSRWGGALPQYAVGHKGRVARARSAVAQAPGLALCGAAYDGLGIPACVGTAEHAAGRILDYLGEGAPVPAGER